MAEETEAPDEAAEGEDGAPKKKSKKPLLFGLILALLLGGGGFYAVYSGMVLGAHEDTAHGEEAEPVEALPALAFVPLEPLVISLGQDGGNRHLRFRAELEINPGYEADVTAVIPRVMDILNSYLRAIAMEDIEDPAALVSLRAQMLRRIQLVTGEGRVRDLLVLEFVLS